MAKLHEREPIVKVITDVLELQCVNAFYEGGSDQGLVSEYGAKKVVPARTLIIQPENHASPYRIHAASNKAYKIAAFRQERNNFD